MPSPTTPACAVIPLLADSRWISAINARDPALAVVIGPHHQPTYLSEATRAMDQNIIEITL